MYCIVICTLFVSLPITAVLNLLCFGIERKVHHLLVSSTRVKIMPTHAYNISVASQVCWCHIAANNSMPRFAPLYS